MKGDVKVAQELVAVARELSALGVDTGAMVDPEAVNKLADKLLARLGPAKSKAIRTYGVEIRPSDTVEQLARAWSTVLLAQ